MSRDNTNSSSAQKSLTSMAELFAQETEEYDDLVVSGLPPTTVPFIRSERKAPVADLAQLTKAWALIGPGGSGKTVLARWLGGELAHRGMLDKSVLAALDPTNRTLATFFEKVMQPPSSDPADTAAWLQRLLQFVASKRANGILDFGGGDVSLVRTIEAAPTIADSLQEQGVGLVAAYVLTPRVDDLAALVTFEQKGFRPRATALVLNLARAATPAAFDAVRRQAAYKAALDRGAVELWMPELSQAVALRIEQARVQFRQARDGDAPAGRKPASISLIERVEVREFLERMTAEFQAVESWLPWA